MENTQNNRCSVVEIETKKNNAMGYIAKFYVNTIIPTFTPVTA